MPSRAKSESNKKITVEQTIGFKKKKKCAQNMNEGKNGPYRVYRSVQLFLQPAVEINEKNKKGNILKI